MNSIDKSITILNWKSNEQVEILSRKLTSKCDIMKQRVAVNFVYNTKIIFWYVGFAVYTYSYSEEGYIFFNENICQTVRFLLQ